MGRPERPLDPESGPLHRFACDLRQLRLDAGSPRYRELARETQYSTSVLSRAASGRELPSLAVTLAYVGACGGDTKDWQARWEALARQSQLPSVLPVAAVDQGPSHLFPEPPPAVVADHESPGPAIQRLRDVVLAAGVLLLVASLAVGWIVTAASSKGPQPLADPSLARAAAPLPLLHNGGDPKEDGCAPGAVTIAQAQIRAAEQVAAAGQSFAQGTVLGTVELRYSARCQAAWARVTLVSAFDHPLSGQETVGDIRPADHAGSTWSPGFVEQAYSDLLLTSGGCVSAYAVFKLADGHQARAATPCRQGP